MAALEIPEIPLRRLADELPDGAVIGLGGAGLQRKPMTAVRALAAAGRRELTVVSCLGSLDVELLLAAGAVAELHSAGVSLDGAGLAPRYRAARQDGSLRFVEWSEGTLLCALQATARDVPSLPTWMALGTDLPSLNPYLRQGRDPFTAEPVMHVRALVLDAAILHVRAVDRTGNAYVDGDLGFDGALARAARRVIVCYEEVIEVAPAEVALSRVWIDGVCRSRNGAWPTGCHKAYRADVATVARWAAQGAGGDVSLLSPAEGAPSA